MALDWPLVPLGELVDPERGISYGIVQPGAHVADGVPIIRAGDLRGNRVDRTSPLRVAPAIEANYARTRLRGGELVMSIVGTVGQTAVVDQSLIGWNTARAVAVIPALEQIGAFWIKIALKSPAARERIYSRLNTTVQATLNLKDVAEIPIALPPKAEREAIASVLKAIDEKFDNNLLMNETLEAMIQAVFSDWLIDFGPPKAKMKNHPNYLASDIWSLFPSRLDKEVPEGWSTQPVLEQANWVNGAAYKDMDFSTGSDALPVVKIAELKNGITKGTRFTNKDLGERYKIHKGELLFSWSGNPDTSIDTFVWTKGDAWLNQHIFAVRPNGTRSKAFLYAMLKFLRKDFAEIARNKQTTGLGHVTQRDLARLTVTIPDEKTEAAFDSVVSPIFNRLIDNLAENQMLQSTQDFLLPNLLSGQIRITDAEKLVAEIS